VYLKRAPRELRRGAIDCMFVLFVVLLYFYVSRGGNQYGPRLYYEAFPFLVVFTVANLFREDRFADKDAAARRMFGLVAISLAVTPLLFAAHAMQERRVIRERMDVFRQASNARLEDAIVLMSGRVGTARSMDVKDLTRNGIDYASPVLYALDRGDQEDCRLLAAYPTRSLHRYTWDAVQRRGSLTPIHCER
jgi:hypothetical protein